eukprot:16450469-Heterocapsa_arctica.AAC.1
MACLMQFENAAAEQTVKSIRDRYPGAPPPQCENQREATASFHNKKVGFGGFDPKPFLIYM